MPQLRLYCITCKRSDLSYEEQAERACLGGANAVQLRDNELSDVQLIEIGARLKDICSRHKALFILNNRPDLALAMDADGVHIGQDDLPPKFARQILGSLKIIGVSVSSLGEALKAEKEGASYIGFGPVFETPVKSEKKALGLDALAFIKKRVKIPVIAIGGINTDNVSQVIESGADGIAAIRAVCGAQDISKAAKDLKAKIEEARNGAGLKGLQPRAELEAGRRTGSNA